MGTMVAVLSLMEMKLFRRDPETGSLDFLRKFENEDYSERNIEVSRHHPGVVKDGSGRHQLDAGTNPQDLLAEKFARKIANFLDHEHKQGRFSDLIVVAEPKMLGRVRTEMSDELKKATSHWIGKDLEKATTATLESELGSTPPPI